MKKNVLKRKTCFLIVFFLYEECIHSTQILAKNQAPEPKWDAEARFRFAASNKRSLGQLDLFMPVYQNDSSLLFLDFRFWRDTKKNTEGNYGLAYRKLSPSLGWIFGGYGFFDSRQSQFGNSFQQITLGVEALSETWDFRTNVYAPFSKAQSIHGGVSKSQKFTYRGHKEFTSLNEEVALKGIDVEVGCLIPYTDNVRLYAGEYYFQGRKVADIKGVRTRLEWRVNDYFYAEADYQYDNVNGGIPSLWLTLRIPFGEKSYKKLNPLEKRMSDVIIRDIDIVTQPRKAEVPTHRNYIFATPGGKGDGTFESPADSNNLKKVQNLLEKHPGYLYYELGSKKIFKPIEILEKTIPVKPVPEKDKNVPVVPSKEPVKPPQAPVEVVPSKPVLEPIVESVETPVEVLRPPQAPLEIVPSEPVLEPIVESVETPVEVINPPQTPVENTPPTPADELTTPLVESLESPVEVINPPQTSVELVPSESVIPIATEAELSKGEGASVLLPVEDGKESTLIPEPQVQEIKAEPNKKLKQRITMLLASPKPMQQIQPVLEPQLKQAEEAFKTPMRPGIALTQAQAGIENSNPQDIVVQEIGAPHSVHVIHHETRLPNPQAAEMIVVQLLDIFKDEEVISDQFKHNIIEYINSNHKDLISALVVENTPLKTPQQIKEVPNPQSHYMEKISSQKPGAGVLITQAHLEKISLNGQSVNTAPKPPLRQPQEVETTPIRTEVPVIQEKIDTPRRISVVDSPRTDSVAQALDFDLLDGKEDVPDKVEPIIVESVKPQTPKQIKKVQNPRSNIEFRDESSENLVLYSPLDQQEDATVTPIKSQSPTILQDHVAQAIKTPELTPLKIEESIAVNAAQILDFGPLEEKEDLPYQVDSVTVENIKSKTPQQLRKVQNPQSNHVKLAPSKRAQAQIQTNIEIRDESGENLVLYSPLNQQEDIAVTPIRSPLTSQKRIEETVKTPDSSPLTIEETAVLNPPRIESAAEVLNFDPLEGKEDLPDKVEPVIIENIKPKTPNPSQVEQSIQRLLDFVKKEKDISPQIKEAIIEYINLSEYEQILQKLESVAYETPLNAKNASPQRNSEPELVEYVSPHFPESKKREFLEVIFYEEEPEVLQENAYSVIIKPEDDLKYILNSFLTINELDNNNPKIMFDITHLSSNAQTTISHLIYSNDLDDKVILQESIWENEILSKKLPQIDSFERNNSKETYRIKLREKDDLDAVSNELGRLFEAKKGSSPRIELYVEKPTPQYNEKLNKIIKKYPNNEILINNNNFSNKPIGTTEIRLGKEHSDPKDLNFVSTGILNQIKSAHKTPAKRDKGLLLHPLETPQEQIIQGMKTPRSTHVQWEDQTPIHKDKPLRMEKLKTAQKHYVQDVDVEDLIDPQALKHSENAYKTPVRGDKALHIQKFDTPEEKVVRRVENPKSHYALPMEKLKTPQEHNVRDVPLPPSHHLQIKETTPLHPQESQVIRIEEDSPTLEEFSPIERKDMPSVLDDKDSSVHQVTPPLRRKLFEDEPKVLMAPSESPNVSLNESGIFERIKESVPESLQVFFCEKEASIPHQYKNFEGNILYFGLGDFLEQHKVPTDLNESGLRQVEVLLLDALQKQTNAYPEVVFDLTGLSQESQVQLSHFMEAHYPAMDVKKTYFKEENVDSSFNLSDEYSPGVIKSNTSKLDLSDEYSPGVIKNKSNTSKLDLSDEYSPGVIKNKSNTSKLDLSDEYSPGVIKNKRNTSKLDLSDEYSPGVIGSFKNSNKDIMTPQSLPQINKEKEKKKGFWQRLFNFKN